MARDRYVEAGGRVVFLVAAACIAAMLLPASAGAETRTFLNLTDLYPTEGAGTGGHSDPYPSRIAVSGLPGTVTKVMVTIIGYASSSPDDTDMAIVGPNGQAVMLMSDACGLNPSGATNDNWTFDDAAPAFLSDNGPCGNYQLASVKPTNYEDPQNDDLTPGGGPAGPYRNALSVLAGGSPNGTWNLFVMDDNPGAYFGFDVGTWALNLEIQPTTKTARKCKKKRKAGAGAAKKCKRKR